MPDISTASAQEIEAWKKETHIGSPTSIIFLTGDQRQLWGEKMLLLLADYSTGWVLPSHGNKPDSFSMMTTFRPCSSP